MPEKGIQRTISFFAIKLIFKATVKNIFLEGITNIYCLRPVLRYRRAKVERNLFYFLIFTIIYFVNKNLVMREKGF